MALISFRAKLALASVAICSLWYDAARAEGLDDAIAAAYQNNPTLQYQRAQLRVTDEGYVQARAGFRPQVSLQATGERRDYTGATANSGSAYAVASQPLYTGGRVGAAVSAASADILSGRETLREAEASVLMSVIQAYADVLRDREGVQIYQRNLDALEAQVKETVARANAGDLTRTDVGQSQTSLSEAHIDLILAKAQLDASNANYAAAVGNMPGALDPLPPLKNLPQTIDQAFATAEAGNPNIRADQYSEQAARLRVIEARDARLPSVALQAQIGASGPISPFAPNIYARDTSAQVTVTQPLFAGGVINSQIREQAEKANAARYVTEQDRRKVVQLIGQSWSAYAAATENASSAEDAVKAAESAYDSVQKERQADLRTTLEVLSIEQSLIQAELARSSAVHDRYVYSATLLQSMGLLEVANLAPNTALYDPAKSYNQVKSDGAVPWEFIPASLDRLTSSSVRQLPAPPTAPVAPTGR
jgi:outer membrane protein